MIRTDAVRTLKVVRRHSDQLIGDSTDGIICDDIGYANDLLKKWVFWLDGVMTTPTRELLADGRYRRRVPDEYAMRILAKVVLETA